MSVWRLAAWAGVAAAAPALAAGPTMKEPKLVRRDGVWHVGQEDRWSWDAQPTPSRGPSLRGPPDSAVDSHWVSAVSGNWEDAVRWSTSPATPNNGGGTTYNVFLDAVGAAYTVGLSTAATVDQLSMPTASALLNIGAGGVLSVAGEATLGGGKIRLDGGQIVGGTYTMSGGSFGFATNTANLMDGVSIVGDMRVGGVVINESITRIRNGLGLTGTLTLGGTNSTRADALHFEGDQTLASGTYLISGTGMQRQMKVEGNAILTIGAGATVRGGNGRLGGQQLATGTNTIINQGQIIADSTVGALVVSPSVFVNQGQMSVTSNGTLTIGAGTWSNTGTIALGTGTLNLGGSVSTSDLGTITRTGGTLNLTGTLLNTGQTLTLNSSTGDWRLSGGTIDGGTVTHSGGVLRLSEVGGNRLRNVTLNGDLDMTSFSFLTLSGTNTINGTVSAGSDSAFTVNQSPSLAGGVLQLRSTSFDVASGETWTIGSGASIMTAPRLDSSAANNVFNGGAILNQGLVSASGVNNTTTFQGSGLTNTGTMETLSGANLRLQTGTWNNTGLIRVNGGTLTLGGTFSAGGLGTIERTGGFVRLTGIMDNAATTTTLNALTGSWHMAGGDIRGGTIDQVQGSGLLFSSLGGQNGSGTFRNLTVNGDLSLPANSSLNLYDGFTHNGVLRLTGSAATVTFQNTQTWNSGTISLESGTGSTPISVAQGATVTMAPGTWLRGGRGGFGSVINQGRVSADLPGTTLGFGSFVNQGIVEAVNGGTLSLSGNWTSPGTIRVDNGTLILAGTFNLNGSTFERNGGTVTIAGTMNNVGGTVNLDGNTGSWRITGGGVINGGTVNMSGGSTLIVDTNPTAFSPRLVGVTLTGDMTALPISGGGALRIDGGMNYNGTMTVRRLLLGMPGQSQTITGGVFAFDPSVSGNEVVVSHTGTNTLSPTTVVRGGGGSIHYDFAAGSLYASAALVNKGLVSADVLNQDFYLQPGQYINEGVTEAINGGRLIIHSDTSWKNTGTIRSAPGSTVVLGGKTTSADLGTWDRNGGDIRLVARVANGGSVWTLNQATGPIALGWGGEEAIIKGGRVDLLDGVTFDVGGFARFDDVQVNGDINVGVNSRVMMIGGFDLNGVIHLSGSGSSATFLDTYEMPRGTIAFEGDGDVRGIQAAGASGIFTIGAAATIRGGNGSLYTSSSSSIINAGLISADVSGQTIRIYTQRFQNLGTIEALNGGTITFVPPGDSEPMGSLYNESTLRIAAGSSLTVGGEFGQSADGTLIMQLGRNSSALLSFYDTAQLDGVLRVQLAPGFMPSAGQKFQLLSASSAGLTGAFAHLDLPSLSGGLWWDTATLYESGSIGVVPCPGVSGVLGLAGLAAVGRRRAAGGGR